MLPQAMPTSMLTVRGHLMPSMAGASTSMHSINSPCLLLLCKMLGWGDGGCGGTVCTETDDSRAYMHVCKHAKTWSGRDGEQNPGEIIHIHGGTRHVHTFHLLMYGKVASYSRGHEQESKRQTNKKHMYAWPSKSESRHPHISMS